MLKNAFREICQRSSLTPLKTSLAVILGVGLLGTVLYGNYSQRNQTTKLMKKAAQLMVKSTDAFAQNTTPSVFMSGHTPSIDDDLTALSRLYDGLKTKNDEFEISAEEIKKIIRKQGTDYSVLDPSGRKSSDEMLSEFSGRISRQYVWQAQDFYKAIASNGCPDVVVKNMLDSLDKAKAPLNKLDDTGKSNEEEIRKSIAREVTLGVDRAEHEVKTGSLSCDLDRMYLNLIGMGFCRGHLKKEGPQAVPETFKR